MVGERPGEIRGTCYAVFAIIYSEGSFIRSSTWRVVHGGR